MKKSFFLFNFLSLMFIFTIFSCEKANVQEKNKERIIEVYTQYSDVKIDEMGIDIDALVRANFNSEEYEALFLKRLANTKSKDMRIKS